MSPRVIFTESHIVKIAKAMKTADLLRYSTAAPGTGNQLPKIRTNAVGSFPADVAETA
jgi:hypothetical protein